jgi:hypothetical protein
VLQGELLRARTAHGAPVEINATIDGVIRSEVKRARERFHNLPRMIDGDDLRIVAEMAVVKCTSASDRLLRIIVRRAIAMEIRRALKGVGEMGELKVDPVAKLPRSLSEAAVKDALGKLPFAEGQMLSSMYYGKETIGSIAKSSKRTRAQVTKVYRSAIDHLKEVLRG